MIKWTKFDVEQAIVAYEMTNGNQEQKMAAALIAAAMSHGIGGEPKRAYKKQKRRPDLLSTEDQRSAYRAIVREELERFDLTWDHLQMGGQMRPVVDCRWTIIWRVRKESDMSFPEIGRLLDLDHTTVLNAFQKMEESDGRHFENKPISPDTLIENRAKLKKIDDHIDKVSKAA